MGEGSEKMEITKEQILKIAIILMLIASGVAIVGGLLYGIWGLIAGVAIFGVGAILKRIYYIIKEWER